MDEWSAEGNRKRIVAMTNDRQLGEVAFGAAVKRWPDARLTFRKGAWVMKRWPEGE